MTEEQRYRMLVSEKWSETIYRIPAEISKLVDWNSVYESMKDGLRSPAYDGDRVTCSIGTFADEGMFKRVALGSEKIEQNERRIIEINKERDDYLVSCLNLDSPMCELLVHRYVMRETWEEISSEVGYSADHCRGFLKDRAMLALYEFIPSEYIGKLSTP